MSQVALIAVATPLFPALAFLVLGARLLLGWPPQEASVVRWVSRALNGAVLASLGVCLYFVMHDDRPIPIELGSWFRTAGYDFELGFLVDALSASMMATVAVLCGLIGRFSSTYLVREPGHARFYLLLCLFATGMLLLVMAGSLDLLIAGWELVGISSMLLIAFFHERTFPVRNALRAFVVYRTCDIGLLAGTVYMHHYFHSANFATAFGADNWSRSTVPFDAWGASLTCLCLLFAASGKSALFPLGSWLPRAMEGPTPSSAIFYGSLSVHAGAYLMLRVHPMLDHAPLARVVVVAVGLATAVHGTLVARVQTDVKSQLAYATTTQVGVIFMEIGAGLPKLALFHLIGHAFVRTLQLLRAPNAIQDAIMLRAVDEGAGQAAPVVRQPSALTRRLYQLSLERFHLDTQWERLVVRPVLRASRVLETGERRWIHFLTRDVPDEAPNQPLSGTPAYGDGKRTR
ncbi:MAG TPA: proton-conducting transporter membrane subunit [Polyangiales bacterium]